MKNLAISLKTHEMIIGWSYFAFQLLGLGTVAQLINGLLGYPLSHTQLNVALFFVNFAAVVVIFHQYLFANLKCFFSRFGKNMALTALGFGLYYGLNQATNMFIYLLDPSYGNANDAAIHQMLTESFGLMFIATVLLVPLTEEVLYRGLLFGSLYRKNKLLGLFLSMGLFSMIHILPYIGTYDPLHLLLSFFVYLPPGFAFAWVYVSTDSIFASTFLHMLINGISILIMRFLYA